MTLRLLCDENIERELVDALTPEFEITWVVTNDELELGTDDPAIWAYATQRDYTVLTSDEDLVSGAAADAAVGHPSVIRLTETTLTDDIVRALRRISQFASLRGFRSVGDFYSPFLRSPHMVYQHFV